ncbi:MAG TPA: LysR family transcriptional regulator [Corynebacterium sp.]|uniref:LysR family transcriptional regulator n=1 Tax=Corynebacterium sp. TaxID=1720 RepID=UPI0017A126D6|nr:LysR family transcriptional regulator [Corynebacterium sp.]HHT31359.1 LysR family transcriptional regulator [Corynebacterium sp.]
MLPTDLDWFLDLARTRHMGDSAANLGIPQPTLSRRLARLEAALGAKLFDRDGRGLELNTRGRAFADAATAATEALRAGAAEVARLVDPAHGPVRLDFMHSLGTWMVPEILRAARTTRPDSAISLHQGAARLLVDRVLADEADLALVGPQPPESLAGGPLAWTPLARQRLAIGLPADHRLAGSTAPLRLRSVAEDPFIAMLPGYGTRLLLDSLADAAGFRPRLVFESMELTTVAGLVSAGLGVALLPIDDPFLSVTGIVLRPIAPAAHRELGMIRRRAADPTPPVAALHDDILALAGSGRWGRQ